ncbi:MAG: hypothetical protein Q9190_001268 [Brigantiaea leucoxantha]
MAPNNKFLFLTSTPNSPGNNPAVQTLIRQHVMQDIGKARRSKDKTKRRNRYYPPDFQQQPWTVDTRPKRIRKRCAVQKPPSPVSSKGGDSDPPSPASEPSLTASESPAVSSSPTLAPEQLTPPSSDQDDCQEEKPEDCSTLIHVEVAEAPSLNLGSTMSEVVFGYPIKTNLATRRLLSCMFDDSLAGNFGLYRKGWLPIGMTDVAAFQQVLSMFVLHLHSLGHGQKMGFPINESLSLNAMAIKSVKDRLMDPSQIITDGVLGAVIGFICHAHLTQDFDRWHMHMNALQKLIEIRGGVDCLQQNTLLRKLLFFVDVIGSAAQDTAPYFPIPYVLLPKTPFCFDDVPEVSTFAQISEQLQQRYEEHGKHWELISVFGDLRAITLFLNHEHQRTAGTVWRDSALIQLWIDPLAHRLLSTASPMLELSTNHEEECSIVFETCRLSALLYLAEFRRRAGVRPVRTACQTSKLKVALQNYRVDWREFRTLRLFALTLGAIESRARSANRAWFVVSLAGLLADNGLQSKNQIDLALQNLMSCHELFSESVERLCHDVNAGVSACSDHYSDWSAME